MIQTIFGSPVINLKVDDVEEVFSKEAYERTVKHLMLPENKFINHPYTRGGKICTTDIGAESRVDTIKMGPLADFLKKTALNYAYLYSDKPIKDLKFCYYWVNLSFQGCEITNHTDQNSNTDRRLIVTFYPKVPSGGANLVFIHNSKGGEWASDCQEKDLVRVVVEQGSIVIFDNQILHAVDVHRVEEPRMCIATEFIIET
jgi:hypothetical protein